MNKPLPKVPKTEIPCNVCGSTSFKVMFADELGDTAPPVDYNFSQETRKTFQIVRCLECGLIFTNPMPHLSDLYSDVIDEIYLASEMQRRITAQHAVETIMKLRPKGRLLDVGCATGVFLDAASEHFQAEGLELSNWAASLAAKRHQIHRKPLSELSFKEEFDIITIWGVIEHFENPRREVQAIYDALRPGGLVVIYTGDVGAWLPRLLGKKWWWYQGMHLFYFSRRTLSRLLDNIGFKVVRAGNHRLYFQLFSLANSLNRYAVRKWLTPALNNRLLRNIMIPLALSGEMVLYAEKTQPVSRERSA